jgi:hypothetical protein
VAFSHGRDSKVWFGGYDLTGYLSEANSQTAGDLAEASPFGSTVKGWVGGKSDATLSAGGFYDGSADAVDEVFAAALNGVAREMTHLIAGDALGARGRSMTAVETQYEVTTPADGVAGISMEAQSAVGPEPVFVVHPKGAETATGEDATAVDGGATPGATSESWAAYLHVFAVAGTGTPTLTARIQDSADNSTFADVTGGAFAAKTAIGSERIAGAAGATLRRYVRSARVISGTGPSITYGIAVNRKYTGA